MASNCSIFPEPGQKSRLNDVYKTYDTVLISHKMNTRTLSVPVAAESHAMPTVFVVDDDQAVRDSLAWLIESNDMQVRTFPSAKHFISDFRPNAAGCLVLDIRMPGQDGLALQDHLNELGVDIPIIFITGHADVPIAIHAIRAGGFEFLEKPFDDQVLLDRIREALAEDHQRRVRNGNRNRILARSRLLTPRERQVMDDVVAGHSNREIAEKLELSPKTVEVYRARVMQKMEATSLPALVQMCIAGGLC